MRKSKSHWHYDRQQLKIWQNELTISPTFLLNTKVFKLVDNAKIVGFFAFSFHGEAVKLESLFILPEYIGKGVGKLLMNAFLEKVQRLPIQIIFLDADPNSEGFYEKFDFYTVSLKSTSIKNRFMPIMIKRLGGQNTNIRTVFETNRLLVRNLAKDDLEDFYEMQSNPNVMRFIKQALTLEQSLEELDRFIRYYDRRDKLFRIWAVIEMTTNHFVGICGVYLNEKGEHEIAYRLLEKYWGKGMGSEIAKDLIHYCFAILQYHEIVAYVNKNNIGSIKIAKQFMNFEKEFYLEKDECIEFVYRQQKDAWLQRESNKNGSSKSK